MDVFKNKNGDKIKTLKTLKNVYYIYNSISLL